MFCVITTDLKGLIPLGVVVVVKDEGLVLAHGRGPGSQNYALLWKQSHDWINIRTCTVTCSHRKDLPAGVHHGDGHLHVALSSLASLLKHALLQGDVNIVAYQSYKRGGEEPGQTQTTVTQIGHTFLHLRQTL